jgi:hypothetical protein
VGENVGGVGGQHYVQERWLILIGSCDIGRLVAMEVADPETLLLYVHMAAVQARNKKCASTFFRDTALLHEIAH